MAIDTSSNQVENSAVQRDSETPLAKKPSFLFIVSTSIVVFTIILVAISTYHNLIGS